MPQSEEYLRLLPDNTLVLLRHRGIELIGVTAPINLVPGHARYSCCYLDTQRGIPWCAVTEQNLQQVIGTADEVWDRDPARYAEYVEQFGETSPVTVLNVERLLGRRDLAHTWTAHTIRKATHTYQQLARYARASVAGITF